MEKIAIDLGGHTLLGARIRLQSDSKQVDIVEKLEMETSKNRCFDDVITQIAYIVQKMYVPECAVGICIPGMLDVTRTKILQLPNFPGWEKAPFLEMLAEKLSYEELHPFLSMENDANCYALGERIAGIARGCEDFVLLTLGSGIGGGIITGGKLLRGVHGMAGELGHIAIADHRVCGCGGLGHAEAFAGADALERIGRDEKIFEDFKLLWSNRKCAKESAILAEGLSALGRVIASLVHIFDPEMVILGGGMSQAEGFVNAVNSATYPYLAAPFKEVFSLKTSVLGNLAALYGAAVIDSRKTY